MGGLAVSMLVYGSHKSTPFFEWIYTTFISLYFIPFTFMGDCYDEVTINKKGNEDKATWAPVLSTPLPLDS